MLLAVTFAVVVLGNAVVPLATGVGGREVSIAFSPPLANGRNALGNRLVSQLRNSALLRRGWPPVNDVATGEVISLLIVDIDRYLVVALENTSKQTVNDCRNKVISKGT